ncbi:hypothetical protein [Methylocystis parvus]|uniref:hypothetical protein n=1 Tax=Methylocystis parvus TaxID=134 RepID=UPI003C75FADA
MKKNEERSPVDEARRMAWEAAQLAELLTVVDFTSEECDRDAASRGLRMFGRLLSDRILDAEEALGVARVEQLRTARR